MMAGALTTPGSELLFSLRCLRKGRRRATGTSGEEHVNWSVTEDKVVKAASLFDPVEGATRQRPGVRTCLRRSR